MTLTRLEVGMRLMLPSGNILILIRRERGTWVGRYTEMARQRGEVEFTASWLRKHCTRC